VNLVVPYQRIERAEMEGNAALNLGMWYSRPVLLLWIKSTMNQKYLKKDFH
jgi:hypothetical protein